MPASVRVAALILAGGESARMGQPKALLELDGRSFVAIAASRLRAAGCDPVLAVDGAHRLDPELAGLAATGVGVVHNPDWRLGPLSSIQAGLRAALELASHAGARELDGLLVHHVERPRITAPTFAALLAAFADEPEGLWQPSYAARSGHPLIFPRAVFADLLALDPMRASARTLVRGAAAGRRRQLAVDDPGVHDNIDTPADLSRVLHKKSTPAPDRD